MKNLVNKLKTINLTPILQHPFCNTSKCNDTIQNYYEELEKRFDKGFLEVCVFCQLNQYKIENRQMTS